jgi:DNA-binding transcriptional ArsR family regulator
MRATSQQPPIEIFKALSDPIRWNIIVQMASVDELACVTLEATLPVSKPTISYHTKILYQAGLITARKSGRNYFYSLRREVLHELLDDLWELAPAQRSAVREADGPAVSGPPRNRPAAPGDVEEAVVLTW